jgi:uncharacterized RDD family membrane protein YckC
MSTYQQPYANSGYNPYAPPTPGADQSPQPHLYSTGEDHILAGRGTRLAAALIDGALALGSALPGIILLAALSSGSGGDDGLIVGGAVAVVGLLALGIYQIYLISTTGQSLAKKWLGIKIIKTDGMPCGFVHGVLLRSWVMGFIGQIPIVGPICSLVDPLLIFGDERRCLHDLIAGTKVIISD